MLISGDVPLQLASASAPAGPPKCFSGAARGPGSALLWNGAPGPLAPAGGSPAGQQPDAPRGPSLGGPPGPAAARVSASVAALSTSARCSPGASLSKSPARVAISSGSPVLFRVSAAALTASVPPISRSASRYPSRNDAYPTVACSSGGVLKL